MLQPECVEAVRSGEHIDTLIGFVAQGGGMLNDLTAKQAEHGIEAEREKRVPSFNDLWAQGFKAYRVGKGKGYVRGREQAWQKHVAGNAIGQMPCNHVTEDAASLFVDSLPLAADGRNKLLQTFRWLSKRAVKAGHLRYCPFADTKAGKNRTFEDVGIKFWHPATEYPLILTHARDDDAREFFGFSMGCGPRPSETKRFVWADVDMEGERLTFRYGGSEDGATKGGEPATVPMVAECKQWLQRRIDRLHGGIKPESGIIFAKPDGEPYSRNYDYGLKGTLEAAGINGDGRKLYAFRHGFCVALANGFYGDHWERAEAVDMMRHSNDKTIDCYYRVLKHRLADKAKRSKPISNPEDFDYTNGGSGHTTALQIAQSEKGQSGQGCADDGNPLHLAHRSKGSSF
jgi:integrase